MKMNKAELESQVKSLEATLVAYEANLDVTKRALSSTQDRLESINKPIISSKVIEAIQGAISDAIRDYDFDDVSSYSYEFEIDYNNQLSLSNICLEDNRELEERLSDSIEYLFNVVDDKDTNEQS
jgi:hypothetical protein